MATQQHAPASTEGSTRRSVMTKAILGLGALIGLAYAALAVRFILPRAGAGAAGEGQQTAGPIASFKVNKPIMVQVKEPTGMPTGIIVNNKGNNSFDAFDFHCTHLQCPVSVVPPSNGNAAYYACPCHGSMFNIDGTVRRGPAPVPLKRHNVRVQNGQVMLGPMI